MPPTIHISKCYHDHVFTPSRLVRPGRSVLFCLAFTSHQHCLGYMMTSSFVDGGRPQLPLRALFQARASTWMVEPPTFRKLGYLEIASSHERIQIPWWESNPQRRGASDSKSMTLTPRPRTPSRNVLDSITFDI